MIKEINRDHFLLQRTCTQATKEDVDVAKDLLDTLHAHRLECVGMAANMIGVSKRIIAFVDMDKKVEVVMMNPEIIKTSKETYQTEEGCLSLEGVREVRRYQSCKVRYQDLQMKMHIQTFYGFTAQIIQHEIDHCNGILI